MNVRGLLLLGLALALSPGGGGAWAAPSGTPAGDGEDLFEARIRPLLLRTCFKCHGGDKTASGLRVDSREALIRGGKRGPALVPGNPEAGFLMPALRYADEEFRMPPKERLAESLVRDVARWISMGAPWPDRPAAAAPGVRHWAFQPPARVDPSTFPGSAEHPVDRLIRASQTSL